MTWHPLVAAIETCLTRHHTGSNQPVTPAPCILLQTCSNCHTSNTPFWRKDRHTGLPLCNACGLYAAKNDHPRPVKLWREGQAPGQPQQRPQHLPPNPRSPSRQTSRAILVLPIRISITRSRR